MLDELVMSNYDFFTITISSIFIATQDFYFLYLIESITLQVHISNCSSNLISSLCQTLIFDLIFP